MNKVNALSILKAGRAIIAVRANWTTGQYGRTKTDEQESGTIRGSACQSASPDAVCWCSVGVLNHLTQGMDEDGDVLFISGAHAAARTQAYRALLDVLDPTLWNSVENFNDSSTHEQVIALWDKAIERLES